MSEAAEQIERAVAIVGQRAVVRSYDLARTLGLSNGDVVDLLAPHVAAGALIACRVESPEYGRAVEYRLSMSGGRSLPNPYVNRGPKKPPTQLTAAQLAPIESTWGVDPSPGKAAISPANAKDTITVSTSDKCEAAFRKRGPMTTRQLRKHVKDEHVSTIVAQCAKAGRFAVLGGKKFNLIYGMPDQEAPKNDGLDMDAVHAARKAKPANRSGGGMPRKQHKPGAERQIAAARQVAAGFRPAIACDGALLLTGAAQQGELNSAETRMLADFLARVERSGARA